MDATQLTSLVAVVVSVVALLVTVFGLRQKAGKDYADSLHVQLEDCCRRVKSCEDDRAKLRDDVMSLMRRVVMLEPMP